MGKNIPEDIRGKVSQSDFWGLGFSGRNCLGERESAGHHFYRIILIFGWGGSKSES